MNVAFSQIHQLRIVINFRVAADGYDLSPNPSATASDEFPGGG